jgi:hypothetical protein
MSSCGIYKYEFIAKNMLIVSKKKTPISKVYIMKTSIEPLVTFEAIEGKSQYTFSLVNFSPDYFKCTENFAFTFEKEKIYYIKITPTGDRAILPIKIYVQTDGKIIQVK